VHTHFFSLITNKTKRQVNSEQHKANDKAFKAVGDGQWVVSSTPTHAHARLQCEFIHISKHRLVTGFGGNPASYVPTSDFSLIPFSSSPAEQKRLLPECDSCFAAHRSHRPLHFVLSLSPSIHPSFVLASLFDVRYTWASDKGGQVRLMLHVRYTCAASCDSECQVYRSWSWTKGPAGDVAR
jgi:hypothetical protein